MAFATNQLFTSAAGVGSGLRVFATSIQPKTFALGTGTIAQLTPVSYNDSTHFWNVWAGGVSEVTNINAALTIWKFVEVINISAEIIVFLPIREIPNWPADSLPKKIFVKLATGKTHRRNCTGRHLIIP